MFANGQISFVGDTIQFAQDATNTDVAVNTPELTNLGVHQRLIRRNDKQPISGDC